MYDYSYDQSSGGIILSPSASDYSKEPRPVYSSELDLLGFDRYWIYPHDDSKPIMWSESSNYIYHGVTIAKLRGGSLYSDPELIPTEKGLELKNFDFIDVDSMIKSNSEILESLVNDTIKRVFDIYSEYKSKIDVFYVAFSGGKDSIVALDIVQRALPHSSFIVVFGDTGMESSDTYAQVESIKQQCQQEDIDFYIAKQSLPPESTWLQFGPPGNVIRWCCTVHKTVPQIMKLREITGKNNFTGFAFTGIRGDESPARSEYDFLNLGEKHKGQYSYHTILNWGSAELFIYLFSRGIDVPIAYVKGNPRVGCLMCPMSPPRHDFIKQRLYPEQMDRFSELIKQTSRIQFSETVPIDQLIDKGIWKKRRSGAGLLNAVDLHKTVNEKNRVITEVYTDISDDWLKWARTLGNVMVVDSSETIIVFKNVEHRVIREDSDSCTKFIFDTNNTKHDIEFASLFRSIIIKTIYCVKCGACAANCPHGQITMQPTLRIGDDCIHCLKCHDMNGRCVRYNSIKNTLVEGKTMKGIDRYLTFGFKKSWIDSYFQYLDDFWENNTELGTKMLDAFCNFLVDSELAVPKKGPNDDKWSRYKANDLARLLSSIGSDSEDVWAIILTNLSYSPQINWYLTNISIDEVYSEDRLYSMLEAVMEGDPKGKGKRNVISSLKNIFIFTPIGTTLGIGVPQYTEKSNGITLNSVRRASWETPTEIPILYSLYRYAEHFDSYQFNMSTLYDDPEAVLSPNNVFNIQPEQFKKIISALSINHPEFISSSFTHNLETIDLNPNRKSSEVLDLLR